MQTVCTTLAGFPTHLPLLELVQELGTWEGDCHSVIVVCELLIAGGESCLVVGRPSSGEQQ